MAQIEIKVPDIGDFKDVGVIELLAKPGDAVQADQSLITVESDKASMEIPSSHAGVLKEFKVKLGDKVSEGSVIAIVEPAAEAAAPAPAEEPKQESTYFPNCKKAKESGAAPLHRGDPGYREELDRDGDGVACEFK